jgi:putative FmdB family regulatory protein
MPLYEYECDTCGHRFEKIRKYSDPPLDQCPRCGATVHKLQSAPAIQFKGTGFYITDYAKKDSGANGKSEEGRESQSEKSEKTDKTEKADRSDKSEKADKDGAKDSGKGESTSTASAGSGSTPAATPSSGTKDS